MQNINERELLKLKHRAGVRMDLNSYIWKDEGFSKNITFIVEEYIGDDIPTQHKYKDLKEALTKAYVLKTIDKLHAFVVMDYNKKCMGTDILNIFDDIEIDEVRLENERLKKENEEFKEFIKEYNAGKLYEEFKKKKEKNNNDDTNNTDDLMKQETENENKDTDNKTGNNKEESKEYKYYFRLRPPSLGTHPKQGLIESNGNEVEYNGRTYWGYALYSRKLSKDEIYDYELDEAI